jgi:hypothetical protein
MRKMICPIFTLYGKTETLSPQYSRHEMGKLSLLSSSKFHPNDLPTTVGKVFINSLQLCD